MHFILNGVREPYALKTFSCSQDSLPSSYWINQMSYPVLGFSDDGSPDALWLAMKLIPLQQSGRGIPPMFNATSR